MKGESCRQGWYKCEKEEEVHLEGKELKGERRSGVGIKSKLERVRNDVDREGKRKRIV